MKKLKQIEMKGKRNKNWEARFDTHIHTSVIFNVIECFILHIFLLFFY